MAIARKIMVKPKAVTAKEAPVKVASAPKAKVEAKPAPVAVAEPVKKARVIPPRPTHTLISLYDGPSAGLNKRKSVTALDHKLFGTKPDYVLTARTEAVAKTLREKYGTAPFARMNADAGVMKYLLMKGALKPVSGDGKSEADTYQFVAKKAA